MYRDGNQAEGSSDEVPAGGQHHQLAAHPHRADGELHFLGVAEGAVHDGSVGQETMQ